MKKSLIAIICTILLSGCVIKYDEIEQKDENQILVEEQSKDITQDVFYNAMIGSFMERGNQNNNAIIHYENIIENGYNKDVVNKLFVLYEDKKDYISMFNLLKNQKDINIIKNHSDYIIFYYIINDNYELAFLNLKKYLEEKDLDLNSNIEKRIFKYNFIIKNIDIINSVYSDKTGEFLLYLKNKGISHYKIINDGLYQDKENFDEKDDIYDIAMISMIDYYSKPDINSLMDLEKLGFDIYKMDSLVLNHFKILINNNEYLKIKELSLFLNNKVNLDVVDLNLFNYLSSFFLFDNYNSLLYLDNMKSYISSDFYYYGKAVINYRMGYKKAASKYLKNVKDFKIISGNLNLYFELIDNLDLLKEYISDVEILNSQLSYYIDKKDLKNINIVKNYIKEHFKKNEVKNDSLDLNLLFVEFLNNEDVGLFKAKSLYLKNRNELYSNFYSYLLALSNKDIKEGLDIIIEYIDKDSNDSVVDTYGWLLYKNGEYKKAIDLYSEHKLIYSQNHIIQYHLHKIYLRLGDYTKSDFHKRASFEILN